MCSRAAILSISSTLQMSGQRSDWREQLHANPSRMEQELAIKLTSELVPLTLINLQS
ncbi:MAG TPA: hypothetical protein VN949_02095 [Candidatus Limnocylindrales bacterium]|nr:hypothetical protein [Candidatus Limnocylindrales bacterium]